MKRLFAFSLLAALLAGCVVTPAEYGYRDGYYGNRGYYRGDRGYYSDRGYGDRGYYGDRDYWNRGPYRNDR